MDTEVHTFPRVLVRKMSVSIFSLVVLEVGALSRLYFIVFGIERWFSGCTLPLGLYKGVSTGCNTALKLNRFSMTELIFRVLNISLREMEQNRRKIKGIINMPERKKELECFFGNGHYCWILTRRFLWHAE